MEGILVLLEAGGDLEKIRTSTLTVSLGLV